MSKLENKVKLTMVFFCLFLSAPVFAQDMNSYPKDPWKEFAASDDDVGMTARSVMPFTQEQIKMLANLVNGVQKASAQKSQPPIGQLREEYLQLGGNSAIPVIHTAVGYTTAIGFSDITGEPWPVERVLADQKFLPGDDGTPEGKVSHIVYISPESANLHGNLVIELVGLNSPIVIQLLDGEGSADYRVNFRIPKAGPNVDKSRLLTRPAFLPDNPKLIAFMTGHIPQAAKRLKVEGGDYRNRAWVMDDTIYFKTPHTLLAPAPSSFEMGTDGLTLYALPDTPYALVSIDGASRRFAFKNQETSP